MRAFTSRRCDLNSPRDMVRQQLALEEISPTSKESERLHKFIGDLFHNTRRKKSKKTTKKKSKDDEKKKSPPPPPPPPLPQPLPTSLFCGTLPTDVTSEETSHHFLHCLRTHAYYVCETFPSSSAARYLLYTHRHLGTYFIGVNSCLIKVDINLPVAAWTTPQGGGRSSATKQHGTLLDGELRYQSLDGGRTDELIYFVTDGLVVDGMELFSLPLSERLVAVHARVLSARHACNDPSTIQKLRKEKIRMEMKPMYHISECQHLLTKQMSGVSKGTGLHFYPIDTSHQKGKKGGTGGTFLSWKRRNMEEEEEEEEEEERRKKTSNKMEEEMENLDDLDDIDFDMMEPGEEEGEVEPEEEEVEGEEEEEKEKTTKKKFKC